jgi:hypothetical protein
MMRDSVMQLELYDLNFKAHPVVPWPLARNMERRIISCMHT